MQNVNAASLSSPLFVLQLWDGSFYLFVHAGIGRLYLLVMNKNTLLWGMGWQLLVVDMNYARSKCVGFMLSLENE